MSLAHSLLKDVWLELVLAYPPEYSSPDMGDVFEIHQKRLFSLDEAKVLLPVVRRITRTAHDEVEALSAQFSYQTDPTKKSELEEKVQSVFSHWLGKIQRLGCEAKGMWLVDFDNGEGYYCWVYPEPELEFFHGYEEGFKGRVKIH